MSAIILRRRKLGRGSSKGITDASTTGISTVRNWKDRFPANLSIVFRWGCTSSLERRDVTVVNTAESIHWCADKKQGRLDMQAAGVKVPKTFNPSYILASFGDGGEGDWGAAAAAEAGLDKEYVLRPARHSQGRDLLHGTLEDIDNSLDFLYQSRSLHDRELYMAYLDGYLSYKIDKVAEYRVFVCQNRAVWVAKKTPGNPEDVAWNVAQGGRFDNVRWGEWPMAVVVEAMKAAKVSGTDFCGVDVMVDAEGTPYVLEVNSAPSQTSPYRQQCVAKAFDYIVQNGKQHFPDPDSPRRWRDAIHPALIPDEAQSED